MSDIGKHRFNIRDSQLYHERFYRMPQWLYREPYRSKLNNNDRVAYMMLRERSDYSVNNQWFDKNGDIYFIYTNEELAELIGVNPRTIQRTKKHLIEVGLLEVEKQSFLPKLKRQLPDRLYLIQPLLNPTDTYIKYRTDILSARSESLQSPVNQRTDILSARKESQSNAVSNRADKMSVNQDIDYKDTNKIHIDTDQHNRQLFSANNYTPEEIKNQNQQLLKSASEFYTKDDNKANTIIDEEGINWLSVWCHTPSQMQEIISLIIKAKHGVLDYIATQLGKAKAADLNLYLAELPISDPEEDRRIKYQLTLKIKRVLNSIRSNEEKREPIKNQTGYMYKAFYNFYTKFFDDLLQKKTKSRNCGEGNSAI